MKDKRSSTIILAVCIIAIAATCAVADDWPQWRGPNRDGIITGFTAPQKWPAQLTQKWKITVGTGCATPALVGDRLYLFTRQGDQETILALNAADGKKIWADRYQAKEVTGAAGRHPGPRSSAVVANGKIVTLGVAGVLSCLNAEDGKLIWRKDPYPDLFPKFFTATSPIVSDGMVITQFGTAGKGAIIALDLATGDEKWKWTVEGPEYASPVLMTVDATKQIVTLTEKNIVAIDTADGKLLWQLPFVPQRRAYNAATPIIEGRTVIYTGAGRGTTAVEIEKQGDKFTTKQLWTNPDLAPQYNTPVLKNKMLFGFSNTGSLYCINASDGKTAWTDSAQYGRGGFAAIVDAGPVMMALPETSELIVYKPDAAAYTEIAKYKVADTPTYAHPVLAGNRIFIKDQDSIAMWILQ
ncbi:MAG: PQQ-like beta-propeller repeat protein [Sedimentisphaerales bacterium]|nr:PQQ-like beta-propeller repeat protein [Sedimentisphaerales bacterium]